MISRAVTLVCGFLIHAVLARMLGPEQFGLYALIISVVIWVEGSVAVGLPSVFRKIISEDRSLFYPIAKSMRTTSLPYCLGITFVFIVASPVVAYLLGDPSLALLLVVASTDITFFGMYSTYFALLNGHGNFIAQSLLSTLYSVSRTVFIVGAAVAGLGVTGALLGNAEGSLLGMFFGYLLMRKVAAQYAGTDTPRLSLRHPVLKPRLMSFGMPYLFSTLFMSVLIHMDIWFVQSLAAGTPNGAESVGFYGAATNLARVPYMLVTAISVSAFPAVSKAVFENRLRDSRNLIRQMTRLQLHIMLPAIAMVAATSEDIVTLLYSDPYLPAGSALRILFVGLCAFTLYSFFSNTIAAQNRPLFGFWCSLALVPIAIGLNLWLIPEYGIIGAALATTIVASVGLLISGTYMWLQIGNYIDMPATFRTVIASCALYLIWHTTGLDQLNVILVYMILGILYVLLLILLREVTIEELKGMIGDVFAAKQER